MALSLSTATNTAASLVISYLSDTRHDEYPGSMKERCDTLIRAIFRETILECAYVENQQCSLSPEEFIHTLIREKIFIFFDHSPQEIEFSNEVRKILIDLARHPFERQFLALLAEEVRACSTRISIQRGISVGEDDFLLVGLPGVGSSMSRIEESWLGFYYKAEVVTLVLGQSEETLFADEGSTWHIQPLPVWRVLLHELLHVYHRLSGRELLFSKLPDSFCWTNGCEQMAITGQGKWPLKEKDAMPECGVKFRERFSENVFAESRRRNAKDAKGLLTRISHQGIPSTSPYNQFLLALSYGASGTVVNMLLEEEITGSMICNSKKVFSAYPGNALNEHGIIEEARLRFVRGLLPTMVDISRIRTKTLFKAIHGMPYNETKTIAMDDPFLYEIRKQQRKTTESLILLLLQTNRTSKAASLLKMEIPHAYLNPSTINEEDRGHLFAYRKKLIQFAYKIPRCGEEIMATLEKEVERRSPIVEELLKQFTQLSSAMSGVFSSEIMSLSQ